MGIQYMTDEAGRKVAVVISLAQWEAIQSELREMPFAHRRMRRTAARHTTNWLPGKAWTWAGPWPTGNLRGP
jgi:hypothetical protein